MNKQNSSFWIPLILGELLLFLALFSGLKMTSDSHLYFEGAEYLMRNGLYDMFSQNVFLAKPILYPLFLIPFIKSVNALVFVHHLLFGISFFLSNRIFSIFTKQIAYIWVYNLLFATSTALIMVHVFVWTEPLFIMFILLYIIFLQKHYAEAKYSSLIMLTFVGVLICTLRHVGVFFVVLPAFLILIQSLRNNESILLKVLSLISFLLPIIYFLVWQWFVWDIGGFHGRMNHFYAVDIISNYLLITEAIITWFVFPSFASYIGWLVFPLLISFVIYSFRLYVLSCMRWTVLSLLGIIGIYLLVLFTKGDMIFSDNERYVSVIFPVLFILLISGTEKITYAIPKIKPHLFVVSGVLILYNIIRVIKNVWFWSDL